MSSSFEIEFVSGTALNVDDVAATLTLLGLPPSTTTNGTAMSIGMGNLTGAGAGWVTSGSALPPSNQSWKYRLHATLSETQAVALRKLDTGKVRVTHVNSAV